MTESTQQEFKDKSQYDMLPILSQSNFIRQVYLYITLLLPCVTFFHLISHSGKD